MQCRLILSRCSAFNESNDATDRCELESPFIGPVTSLNVLKQRQVFVLPKRYEVFIGEVGNFTCVAYGSFIAMFWQFNNSVLNCNESGCDNTAAFVQERNISYSDVNRNITIESTLKINTEGLSPSNYVVACVITQRIPSDFIIQGRGAGAPEGIFSSLLILRNYSEVPDLSPTATTTSTDSETNYTNSPSPTAPDFTTNLVIGISIVTVIIVSLLIIIFLIVFVKRFCRGHQSQTERDSDEGYEIMHSAHFNTESIVPYSADRLIPTAYNDDYSLPLAQEPEYAIVDLAETSTRPASTNQQPGSQPHAGGDLSDETGHLKTCAEDLVSTAHNDVYGLDLETEDGDATLATENASGDACTEGEISATHNDTYGLPLPEYDEEPEYTNVRLYEATMRLYTDPSSTHPQGDLLDTIAATHPDGNPVGPDDSLPVNMNTGDMSVEGFVSTSQDNTGPRAALAQEHVFQTDTTKDHTSSYGLRVSYPLASSGLSVVEEGSNQLKQETLV